jgi:hypothetical protein
MGYVAGALVALPAAAGGAPVSDEFLRIGGPDRLTPKLTLKVPIRCSVECHTTVFTTLRIPGPNIGPDKTTGHLQPATPRKLLVTLNNSALQTIQDSYARSRLRVVVTAENAASGEKVRAVRVLRFSAP